MWHWLLLLWKTINFLFLHMWCCLPSLFISSFRSLVLPVRIKSLPLVEAQELQQWLLRPLCKLPQPHGQGKHASWKKTTTTPIAMFKHTVISVHHFPNQGSYGSWKTWKVMEFKYFSFQAWKLVEFNWWLCQKIPKNKDDIDRFWKWQLNFRTWKTGKSHRKGHGKSWNLKSSKEYESCQYIFSYS